MVETLLVREPFTLTNLSHEPLHGDLRFQNGAVRKKPVLIICHSFMAFKDWGFFPHAGEQFAEKGFGAITFNFSQNGVEDDEDRITRFDRFEANTISREIADLGAVIDAVADGKIGPGILDAGKIVILGHSRGGGVAIIRAAIDRRVGGLVTWSAVSTFDRWTQHQKLTWRKLGYLPLSRDTAAGPLRLGINLLNDLEQHPRELSIADAAGRVGVPWLLLHGEADVSVPIREAEMLYMRAPKSTTEYEPIAKAGHLFKASSRDEDQFRTLDSVIEWTVGWLHNHII